MFNKTRIHEEDDNFSLAIYDRIYFSVKNPSGKFIDTETGDVYRTFICLYVKEYDENGNKLDKPIFEQPHYRWESKPDNDGNVMSYDITLPEGIEYYIDEKGNICSRAKPVESTEDENNG